MHELACPAMPTKANHSMSQGPMRPDAERPPDAGAGLHVEVLPLGEHGARQEALRVGNGESGHADFQDVGSRLLASPSIPAPGRIGPLESTGSCLPWRPVWSPIANRGHTGDR